MKGFRDWAFLLLFTSRGFTYFVIGKDWWPSRKHLLNLSEEFLNRLGIGIGIGLRLWFGLGLVFRVFLRNLGIISILVSPLFDLIFDLLLSLFDFVFLFSELAFDFIDNGLLICLTAFLLSILYLLLKIFDLAFIWLCRSNSSIDYFLLLLFHCFKGGCSLIFV